MKGGKYLSHPFSYAMIIIILIVFGIILCLLNEFGGMILAFSFALIFIIPFIIFRKLFFSRMIIDSTGIKVFYKKTIINKIDWTEIKYALAISNSYGGQIIFSTVPILKGKESWKNYNKICISFNSELAIDLYKHKDKIPVKIDDLEKLPKSIQERLT